MDNYLIETLNSPTNSKVISGTIGTYLVLIATLFIGKTLQTKKYDKISK